MSAPAPSGGPQLFGVFGDREAFDRVRPAEPFDRILEGSSLTVGVRDPHLDLSNRTTTATDGGDAVALYGEVCADGAPDPATRFLDAFRERGRAALSDPNGSYLAAVDVYGEAFVATDPVRSRECFYADVDGVRLFSTEPMAVADTLPDPTLAIEPMLEFLLFSVILGDRTVFEELHRIPFDGLVRRDSVESLDRFVYRPRTFDYASELASRLSRAVERRADYPGRHGVLLSAGYDSRILLSQHDGLDVAYTLDRGGSAEAATANRIAGQYGVAHCSIPADGRYLNTDIDAIRHGQGIKESLHIHQAGYESEIDADVMYHGLLFDTYLRGHFLPRDGVSVAGRRIPRESLDPDPSPADVILDRLGLLPIDEAVFHARSDLPDDARTFARQALQAEFDALADRCDSVYNHIAVVGIANQPSIPFRNHLIDHYLESFVAADADLLEWHLQTPPEHRNDRTFLNALRCLDADILRHRPPDRPHDSLLLNQAERFIRRQVPGLEPFAGPWPDRRQWYRDLDLDDRLFESEPAVYRLTPRVKLRANDLATWIPHATDRPISPVEVLRPHTVDWTRKVVVDGGSTVPFSSTPLSRSDG